MQKISYIITRSHPDFHVYDCMSLHARETYNVFLALTRSYFFHRCDILPSLTGGASF